MGKKYVMFVDERGFWTDKNENFTMMGIVFECEYCSDSKYYECELKMKLDEFKKDIFGNGKSMSLDDIILKEITYKDISSLERARFINQLPELFKGLKFSIIASTVKNDMRDSYSMSSKKLLKEFYTYILKKNGQAGGIVLEAKSDKVSYIRQQHFFDIYNERNENLNILGDISEKICTFMVCEKSNQNFGAGIEVLNILNNIFFRVSNGHKEFDSKLVSYMQYGNRNKIFDIIRRKMYRDVDIRIGESQTNNNSYNNISAYSEELQELKERVVCKNIIIDEKDKEIKKLTYQVELLKKQLESELIDNNRDTMVPRIVSDLNVKIQGFDKLAKIAKN